MGQFEKRVAYAPVDETGYFFGIHETFEEAKEEYEEEAHLVGATGVEQGWIIFDKENGFAVDAELDVESFYLNEMDVVRDVEKLNK